MGTPRCWERGCKHYIGIKQDAPGDEKSERNVCTAFPAKIPDDIAYGSNLHLAPVPGDHGIQFEPKPIANTTIL